MAQFLQDPMLEIIWFGLAALVLSPAAAAAVMLFGWAWAPFAALICWLRARSLGLPPKRYAAIGALYSALFFLPWAYLTLRMFGKTVGGSAVSAGYLLLYAVWFCGPIAISFLSFAVYVGFAFSSDPADPDPTAFQLAGFGLTTISLIANVGGMIFSVIKFEEDRKRLPASEREGPDLLPNLVYIMPFMHTFAAVAATAAALALVRVLAPSG